MSVVLTGDGEIQKVSTREYRGIDSPTDVLSFPLIEPPVHGEPLHVELVREAAWVHEPVDGPIALGDIVISWERAKVQAEEYGHSLRRELAFLTVHGLLHLLGYDHESEEPARVMRARGRIP